LINQTVDQQQIASARSQDWSWRIPRKLGTHAPSLGPSAITTLATKCSVST